MTLEPWLIVPDCHIPYEDRRAWDLLLQIGEALKPRGIITLGDTCDLYTVSSHSKNPTRGNSLEREARQVRNRLAELRRLGANRLIFLGGNHEDRLERYLQDKAPELFETVTIPGVLGLKGWTYVPYKSDFKLGRLYAVHDVGYAGRFGAQRLLDTYQHCVVGGHTHRLSYIVEGNAAGECHVACTLGWLGDVRKVDYMHRVKATKDWALAFGVAYLCPRTGFVHLQPVPIIHKGATKYSAVVEGVEYRA